MTDVLSWDTSAANNNSAAPDGFPENMAPSGVNNSAREVMAAVKRYADDIGGVTTSGGSSNAYTLAAAQTITAYAAGQWFAFVANHANTGAATLNVDSVGAKTIKKNHDEDLVSGDIESDQVVVVYYQATDDIFEMVSQVPVGDTKDFTYTELTAAQDPIAAGVEYVDKSGSNTHVMDDAANYSDGDEGIIRLPPGSTRVATVNFSVTDGSGEFATLLPGDFVHWYVVDGSIEVKDEKGPSYFYHVVLTADDSVNGNAKEQTFDENISEETDFGGAGATGQWTAPTLGDDLILSVEIFAMYSVELLFSRPVISGTPVRGRDFVDGDAIIAGYIQHSMFEFDVSSGQNVIIETFNDSGSVNDIRGDAGKDESWMILRGIGRRRETH